jgi:hypothetical protein
MKVENTMLIDSNGKEVDSAARTAKNEEILKSNEEQSSLDEFFQNLVSSQRVIENYTKFQPTAFQLRGHVIEWLYLINTKLQGSRQVFFKSMGLFDEFLVKERSKVISKENIQLFAATCYFIATKLEEVSNFSIEFLKREILKDKFSREEILRTEIEIIKKLNMKLQTPTLQKFSDYFIEKLRINLHSKLNSKFINTFTNMNFFVNTMSQFVNELIFDMESSRLAIINVKSTLLFLEAERLISEEEVAEINSVITQLVSSAGFGEEQNEIEVTAESLYEAIDYQKGNSKREIFFKIYNDCLNQE